MESIRNHSKCAVNLRLFLVTLAALAVLIVGTTAFAKPRGAENLPGYVDGSGFSEIADREPDSSTLVEVNVGKPMLRVMAKSFLADDMGMASMFKKLESVTAVIIGLGVGQHELREEARDHIDETVADLQERGWERLARIREASEEIHVMVRYGDEEDEEEVGVIGLTVMISGHHENDIVFVNICGEIDLSNMGMLGTTMSLPGLDHVKTKDAKPDSDDEDDEDDEDDDDDSADSADAA